MSQVTDPHQRRSYAAMLRERWSSPKLWQDVATTIAAFVLAFLVGAILMIVSDTEVRQTFSYFFARPGERVSPVGFASRPVRSDGVRWMLHAPEGGELVEEVPLPPSRQQTLVAAGRVRKPDAGQGHRRGED